MYRRTVEEIIGYVLHSLRSPEGAFFSAEDADSPDGEGAFYVWTLREIEELLGNGDAAIAALVFDLTAEGNYHDAERGHGFNILHRPQPLENIAESLQVPREELELRVATIASRLLKARGERARPSLDDKVLADWNGLWTAALAQAGRVFDNPGWVDVAKTALNFILSRMRSDDGGLLHRYREGEAAIPGFADDYACIIHALIELYETTFDPPLIRTAVELNQYLSAHFHDAHEGGYFTVSDTAEALIVRKKEIYDGAIPSCNSVAFMNLIRLSRLTGDPRLEEHASALSRAFAGTIGLSPSAYTWYLCGLDLLEDPSHDVIIVGAEESEDTRALVSAVRSGYLPSLLVLRFTPGPEAVALADLAPFSRNLSMTEGRATAYVCTGHSCSMPGTDPGVLTLQINVKKF